jgi:uroporphyrin-III C-methyltransferase / precorrin-2 dehydrogenase / sirohydrochlorin ferrochelatase
MTGLVSLVGAGPGDPELLTLKAVRRLAAADLVLYDALVSPDTLSFAGHARRCFVGKRAGQPAIAQAEINDRMIRAARSGQRVVRLKCGDPFVFGRGGEEALALASAGIRCEVIPGITTAVAAPLLAGIPVTHRGVASAFVVVSGHAASAFEPVFASLEPHTATIVVMMGLANRAEIARALVSAGWRRSTPAAIVCDASHADEHVWRGTLDGLRRGDRDITTRAAGTIVIGEVVDVLSITTSIDRAITEPSDRPITESSEALCLS